MRRLETGSIKPRMQFYVPLVPPNAGQCHRIIISCRGFRFTGMFLTLFLIYSLNRLPAQTVDTITISVRAGWNLLTVPLVVPDNRTTALFPNAASMAYAYRHGYASEERMNPGSGYWLKFNAAEEVTIIGERQKDPCIPLLKGWNMVGMFARDISLNKIYTEPRDILTSSFYGFDSGGYHQADTIKEGEAFWVKSKTEGSLTAIGGAENWEFVTGMNLSSLAFHPADSNIIFGGIHYSNNIHGMFLKSSNYGKDWDTLLRNVDVGYSIIDTTEENTIYVIGGINSNNGPAIFKTTNGGKNWFHTDSGISIDWETGVTLLPIIYQDRNILYSYTWGFWGGDPYKSTNGGVSWFRLIADSATCENDTVCHFDSSPDLDFNPQNYSTLYQYKTWSPGQYFLISYDGGEHWSVSYNLPQTAGNLIWRLVDAKDSNTVYVQMDSAFYKSTDGGFTWENISNGLPHEGWVMNLLLTEDKDVLFIVYYDFYVKKIYQTLNGGKSWSAFEINGVRNIISDYSGNLYVLKEDGVYRQKILTQNCH